MILLNDTIGVATQLLVIQDSDPRHESPRDSNIFFRKSREVGPSLRNFFMDEGFNILMTLDVLCLMTAFFTSLEIESPGKNTRPPATANLQQTLAAFTVWSHCTPVDVSLGLFT